MPPGERGAGGVRRGVAEAAPAPAHSADPNPASASAPAPARAAISVPVTGIFLRASARGYGRADRRHRYLQSVLLRRPQFRVLLRRLVVVVVVVVVIALTSGVTVRGSLEKDRGATG